MPTQDDGSGMTPDMMSFSIIPKTMRNSVTKDLQVLNSEHIIGYNTYSMIQKDMSQSQAMDDSEYYNVTVNFIVKRGSEFQM